MSIGIKLVNKAKSSNEQIFEMENLPFSGVHCNQKPAGVLVLDRTGAVARKPLWEVYVC
jgi:hypothetical protein